jgi:oligo-1,6-glucosidase
MRHNAWPVQFLSNHDSARQVSCFGSDGEDRAVSAKLLATLIHTCPGTPFIYQGEEIGMTNVRYASIEDHNCCYTLGDYHSMVQTGTSPEEALAIVGPRSRDNARTPYQWDDSENAGFSTGKPWIKVNPRYPEINLKNDLASKDSIFAYYRALIRMRQEHPAIIDGEMEFLLEDHPQVFMYLRHCARETLLIVINYSDKATPVILPEKIRGCCWKRELSNREDTVPSLHGREEWLPWEAEIYSLAR